MTVVGLRTWLELRGEPCIDLEVVAPRKKQICVSRSFGVVQTDIEGISEAVATYASLCAEKLRRQKSCAVSLLVFVHTGYLREENSHSYRNTLIHLPVPTNSSIEIVRYARMALERIFIKGYRYKKAGVIITEIVPESGIQLDLYDSVDREKHKKLMQVVDRLNSGFSCNKLILASQGTSTGWRLKMEKLSQHFTTDINQIIKVKCK